MSMPEVWGIDGDIILYSASFAAKSDPVSYACQTAKTMCNSVAIFVEAGETIIYLTGKNNYRLEYESEGFPYKGHRKSQDKPSHYPDVKKFMIEELGAIVVEGQEADDQLGIDCCTKGHGIATLDKDLWGVPGWHYNWKKGTLDNVSELEANRFFYTQLITGDSTDNIPGLFKRTGAKAYKDVKAPLDNLDNPLDMYQYVKSVYLDNTDQKDQVDDWLLRQGRQLWIRRKENELWSPPDAET